jgi:NTP pyrophosphatase (non-canonical NTP hydrolase)
MNQPTSPAAGLDELARKLRAFAAERDWEPYHTPKNLAAALIVEAAELLEHFQWLGGEESGQLTPERRDQVALEMADVLLYLVRLADRLGVDLLDAASRKLALNALKYPVALARGTHAKYTDLGKP